MAAIHNLPDGAGPIQYQRDFGDTSTLMLTVASPKASPADIELRAARLRAAIESARAGAHGKATERASLMFCFPAREESRLMRMGAIDFLHYLRRAGAGVNAAGKDDRILALLGGFLQASCACPQG